MTVATYFAALNKNCSLFCINNINYIVHSSLKFETGSHLFMTIVTSCITFNHLIINLHYIINIYGSIIVQLPNISSVKTSYQKTYYSSYLIRLLAEISPQIASPLLLLPAIPMFSKHFQFKGVCIF